MWDNCKTLNTWAKSLGKGPSPLLNRGDGSLVFYVPFNIISSHIDGKSYRWKVIWWKDANERFCAKKHLTVMSWILPLATCVFMEIYRIRPNYRTVRLGFSKLLGTLRYDMYLYLLRIHYKKIRKGLIWWWLCDFFLIFFIRHMYGYSFELHRQVEPTTYAFIKK